MHPAYRLLTSLIIWLAVVGIVAIIFLSSSGATVARQTETFLGALAILGGAASLGTRAVWRDAGYRSGLAASDSRADRKAKGDPSRRVTRLVDLLDEDEIIELETLLLARDEERYASGE